MFQGDSIEKLQEKLDSEIKYREEGYEKILQFIGQEIKTRYEIVENFAKDRDNIHSGFSNLIKEVEAEVMEEVRKERSKRAIAEETLIKLLEETCDRVEQGLKKPLSNIH